MNRLAIIAMAVSLAFIACHSHSNKENDAHNHSTDAHAHSHDEVSFPITAYSTDLEVFAESDPFIANKPSSILAHFTYINSFTPVTEGSMTAILNIDGEKIEQTIDKPTRTGIYKFTIKPSKKGNATIRFEHTLNGNKYYVESAPFKILDDAHKAIHYAEKFHVESATAIPFTKEQSWKVAFRTDYPMEHPFGTIIKSVAKVDVGQSAITSVSAKVAGTVSFGNRMVLAGTKVKKGEVLLSVLSDGASNNAASIYTDAKANYEKATTHYQRIVELAKDNLVPNKDLVEAKAELDKAESAYKSMAKSITEKGQVVIAPASGFVTEVFVTNGSYVEQGTPLLTVAEENNVTLTADVPQRYAHLLDQIEGATVKTGNKTLNINELNGKLISVGKSLTNGSTLIPVAFKVNGNNMLYPGSLVEVFIRTTTTKPVITIPNDAILEDQGHYFVFVQLTPELFEKQEITIGQTDGLRTEIVTGINKNQRVVTKGAILVKLAAVSAALDPHAGHVH